MRKISTLLSVAMLLLVTGCKEVYTGTLIVERPLPVLDVRSHEVTIPVGEHPIEVRILKGYKLEFRVKDKGARRDLRFTVSGIDVKVDTEVRTGDEVISYEEGLSAFEGDDGQKWSLEGGASMNWGSYDDMTVKECTLEYPDPIYGKYGIRRISQRIETQMKSLGASFGDSRGTLARFGAFHEYKHKLGDPEVGRCESDYWP